MPKVTGPKGYITVQEAARKLKAAYKINAVTSDAVATWLRRACHDGLIPYQEQPIGDPHNVDGRTAKLVRMEDVINYWDS